MFWAHWDIHCPGCVGEDSSLCCSIGCVFSGKLSLNTGMILFSEVLHGWCWSHNGILPVILVALAGCNWEPSCLVHVNVFIISTVLRKTILVSSECVNGGNWYCYGSGSDWVNFSCVDLRPFWGCWRCPSMVDCFLDKYLCTSSNNRPGQKVKKFLVIDFTHPDWVGLQHDA